MLICGGHHDKKGVLGMTVRKGKRAKPTRIHESKAVYKRKHKHVAGADWFEEQVKESKRNESNK